MTELEWVVLDVDGVMIAVEESYDLAVKKTAEKLLKDLGIEEDISLETIRDFRFKGKFGDDYQVTEFLVLATLDGIPEKLIEELPRGAGLNWIRNRVGTSIGESEVMSIFDRLYLGADGSASEHGLWKREKPLVETSLLDRIDERFNLGFVTGRSREELELASRILDYHFSNAVTRNEFLKPNPDALASLVGTATGVYLGDTVNDELLVENFNEDTDGEFSFVLIDHDTSVNQVLKEIIAYSDRNRD